MTTTDDLSAPAALTRLVLGGWTSQAIRTLAKACHVDTDSRARLVALLAALRLCDQVEGGTMVAATDLGALLRSDVPGSLKAFTAVVTAPWIARVWEALPDAISAGRPAFAGVHGCAIWDYLQANPEDSAVFDAAMTGGAELRAAAILETCTAWSLGC